MGKKKPKSKPAKPSATSLEIDSVSDSNKYKIEAIAAAICSANQAVFMKVCRLCESKDGPFLNIFDADKVTAKKIDELMPFGIAENDDLPHKICFRCSAKVEELYEFIHKCIKTQHNLNKTMGRKEPLQTKTRTRTIWEEKLHKSNMSNDDICDALIKKAMEGIKDIPLNSLPLEDEPEPIKKINKPRIESPKPTSEVSIKSEDDVAFKNIKVNLDKCDQKFIPTRSSRSQKSDQSLLDGLPDYKKKKSIYKQSIEKPKEDSASNKKTVQISSDEDGSSENDDSRSKKNPPSSSTSMLVQATTPKPVQEPPKPVEPPKPFDIMDHVSAIKVHSVGILFQCRLCNRNFLKKEMVTTHGCAKNGGPRVEIAKNIAPPDPPKIATVKYINTKIDGEPGKLNPAKSDQTKEVEPNKPSVPTKLKPRIGPASRVKRPNNNHNSLIGMTVAPIADEKSTAAPKDLPPKDAPKPTSKPLLEPSIPQLPPSVQIPTAPSLNSRYKLLPGPNNTFQLVEENQTGNTETGNVSKKRRNEDVKNITEIKKPKQSEPVVKYKSAGNPEVVDLEENTPPTVRKKSDDQPYPVGLFQTLPHHSSIYSQPTSQPPTFTTPAMKKQSYSIVQTGNPSKLLISTKPQLPVEEAPKKKLRKNKHEVRTVPDEPYHVTLEDTAPPKDHGFFNFINVDPLLQPSYVLPTDTIIQESQISTSTAISKPTVDKDKDKYSCNMCGEHFTREKKLLAHIHSHYNKMDEEDMQREKNNKKRRK